MARAWVYVLLCMVIGLWPRTGAAQPDLGGVTEVYAAAGISQPVSPTGFREFWDAGNQMTAGVGLEGSGVFVLRMGFRYNRFVLDTSAVAADEALPDTLVFPDDRRYYVFGTTFDLLLDVPSPVDSLAPYLLVGLTIYHTDLGDMSIDEEVSEAYIEKSGHLAGGMNVGLGLSYMLSPDVETFLEYMLIGGFAGGDKKVFTPLSLGLSIHI